MRIALCSVLLLAFTTAAVERERVYSIGGEVKAPVRIKYCEPVFPEKLRATRLTTPYFLYEMVVSSRGEVTSLRLLRGRSDEPYKTLDRAFQKALRCWRFKPATRGGRPVASRMTITGSIHVR